MICFSITDLIPESFSLLKTSYNSFISFLVLGIFFCIGVLFSMFIDKNKKIKILTENNEALNSRVKTLNDTIKDKDNEILFLKSKINDLRDH